MYNGYDLVVVGGGIGGLSAAITAKKQGVESVLVLERANEVGQGVICGGGLTNKFVDIFPGVLKHLDEIDGKHYTGDDSVWYIQGNRKFSLTNSNMVVCSRNKYDAMLARMAEGIGVKIRTGATAKSVNVSYEKATVNFSSKEGDGSIDAEFVYDCSGVLYGKVDGPLNFKPRFGNTLQFEFNIRKEEMQKVNPPVSVFFPEGKGYQGYGWVFPSASSLHVGEGTNELSEGGPLNGMIEEITETYCPYIDIENTPKIVRGQKLPYPQKRQVGWWRYGIGGDKACFVNIQGEGNYYTQLGGVVFGWLVADHLKNNDYSMREYDGVMEPVQDSLLESIKKFDLIINPLVSKIVFGLAPRSYRFRNALTNSIRAPPPIGGTRDISEYVAPFNSVLGS